MVDEQSVRDLVRASVSQFAEGFRARHEGQLDDPQGTLNMKIHNVFIQALGDEVRYYSALVRSLDSSLGNMLERLAINIAELSYEVNRHVAGPLSSEQTTRIATLLEAYKRRQKTPEVSDYQDLRGLGTGSATTKRHDSDYYLVDRETQRHYLIELKIGGDLDNKKARSEKEALLEQFCILSNSLPAGSVVRVFFATAYNRFGEGREWRQERVRQYFASEELLIGRDFWNFVCRSDDGYSVVLDEYCANAHLIKDALSSIRQTYLGWAASPGSGCG